MAKKTTAVEEKTQQVRIYTEDYKEFKEEADKRDTTIARIVHEKKIGWRLLIQDDRDLHDPGFVEAICPHGIGHHKGVHGCDGCCKSAPRDIWEKVTEDK